MLTEFKAQSNLRGYSIDLNWCWSSPNDRPALVLLRRTGAYPVFSKSIIDQEELLANGLTVVDVEQNFDGSDTWSKTQREMFLGRNDSIESNLLLAEFSQYFSANGKPAKNSPLVPDRIVIAYYDFLGNTYNTVELTDIISVIYNELTSEEWAQFQRWQIFHAPGGGATVPAGEIIVASGHVDGVTSDQFSWQPEGMSEVSVEFDHSEKQLSEITIDEIMSPDTGDWTRNFNLVDKALQPETIYYYRLYLKQGLGFVSTEYQWTTESVATKDYQFSDKIYALLPGMHRYYDEPEIEQKGRGQLRRYLSVAGASLDHNRSMLGVARDRHNTHAVYSKALPNLAHMIGWLPDLTSDSYLLRKDIADAPNIYRTVGTLTNLRSVVNRVTQWNCEIKEFVHNIFLTNAVEPIRLWEIWSQQHDGIQWSAPQLLTESNSVKDSIDGHPHVVDDTAATTWLFFHSDRNGARNLMRINSQIASPSPRPLILRNIDEQELKVQNDEINEYPSVLAEGDRLWLFWCSNRNGVWNIWSSWSRSAEPFSTGPDIDEMVQNNPVDLSEHAKDDRHPTVVRDSSGVIWLFWQSNRRGQTDIWSRTYDGSTWSSLSRVTTAEFRHLSPTVVIDADERLWLFYCNDLGNRININALVNVAGVWSLEFEITTGVQRDEAPSAVFWNGAIHLFWQSNRNNRWQVFSQSVTWSGSEPIVAGVPEMITDEVTSDKEPFVRVDAANQLNLYWRSQRTGTQYQSRSIDTNDPGMIAELGSFNDRAHYSYDTNKNNNSYYARDTVGVFLTPNSAYPDLDDRNRRLFDGPLKEFVPINIRPVLFIAPEVHEEYVYTYDAPEIEPQRLIVEEYLSESNRINEEIYSGLSDNYSDTIPEWNWIRAWDVANTDTSSVDTTSLPIDIHYRTWHTGLNEG